MIQEILFASEWTHKEALLRGKVNLAHYTRASSALGIIENHEIWLTNVGGMNDLSECRYARDLLLDLTEGGSDFAVRMGRCMPRLYRALRLALEATTGPTSIDEIIRDSSVFCMSEEGPEHLEYGRLSMWRGYGREVPVRLLFKASELSADSPDPGAPVVHILYGPNAVAEELVSIANGFEQARLHEDNISDADVNEAVLRFVIIGSLSIKHPCFSEEAEWRMIHNPQLRPSESVFKTGANALRGRIEVVRKLSTAPNLKFLHNGWADILHSVTIGPCERHGPVINALRLALDGVPGGNVVQIHHSNIPFRAG